MDIEENQNPNPGEDGSLKAVGSFLWDLLKIFIIALVIIIPFRIFVAEPFVVSGSSMLPNFHNGDYLIVDRLTYRFSPPARGDVIVLKYPKDTSQFFIKRIIGLPGDKVCFSPDCKTGDQDGHVYIFNSQYPQGFRLNESYIPAGVETLGQSMNQPLGSDEYFVLGDNRTASSDSRIWGILPADDIVGRVWLRVFPPEDAGIIRTPAY